MAPLHILVRRSWAAGDGGVDPDRRRHLGLAAQRWRSPTRAAARHALTGARRHRPNPAPAGRDAPFLHHHLDRDGCTWRSPANAADHAGVQGRLLARIWRRSCCASCPGFVAGLTSPLAGGESIRIGCKPHATYLQGSVIGRLAGRCTLQEQFPLLLSLSFFQPDVDVWGTANEHH